MLFLEKRLQRYENLFASPKYLIIKLYFTLLIILKTFSAPLWGLGGFIYFPYLCTQNQ